MQFKATGRFIRAPKGDRPLPPKATMAKNLAGAVRRNVAAYVAGQRLTITEEQQQARFATCQGCEFFRQSDERCAHKNCGCRLRIKTRLKAERCPAGKW